MQIGVVFPQTEIGADPIAVRDYAQAAEQLGFDHLIAFDHVLGANRASRPDWQGPYDHRDMFHEPFVLYGYLAGVTERIGLVTGIIILPQRQTALVAKQAAAVDVLSGGRLRLGIGIGWNPVEYEALGENFGNRGRRSEEQIAVLRALWTEPSVSFTGEWHQISDAGLNPMPVQRPIPIWFGGESEPVLRRIARLGDGWLPRLTPDETGRALIEKLQAYAREAGRDPAEIGIEAWIPIRDRNPEDCAGDVAKLQAIGATHVSVHTMPAGLAGPDAHIAAIRRFKQALPNS